MATVTWTGVGADVLASTDLNWDTATAPANGDDVVFDGAFPVTGDKDCDWDLVVSLASFTTSSGYDGDISVSVDAVEFGPLTLDHNGSFGADPGVNTATASSVTITGTANVTWDLGDAAWTVGGNITATNANLAIVPGASVITITASIAIDCAQAVNDITTTGAFTITLSSPLTCNEFEAGGNTVIDGSDLHLGGFVLAGFAISGTSTLTFDSNGTIDGSAVNASIANDILVDNAGTTTITGNVIHSGNLTWQSGTIAGTFVWAPTGTPTYDTGAPGGGFVFYDFVPAPGLVLTNNSNLDISHELTLPNSGTDPVTINGSAVQLAGDLTQTAASVNNLEGTSVLIFTGSAAQAWDTAAVIAVDVEISKSGGTLTGGAGEIQMSGSFTYISGSATFQADLLLSGGTFSPGSLVLYGVQITGAVTLGSNVEVDNDYTVTVAHALGSRTIRVGGTFSDVDGNVDFGTSTVIFTGASSTATGSLFPFNNLTIESGASFTVQSGGITVDGHFASNGGTILSDTPSVQSPFVVNGTQAVSNTTATDIDSSGGNEVSDPGGTLDNTINWVVPVVVASTTGGALQFGGFPRFPSFQNGART